MSTPLHAMAAGPARVGRVVSVLCAGLLIGCGTSDRPQPPAEGMPQGSTAAAATAPAARPLDARRAAREFFESYVAVLYGHRRTIRHATTALAVRAHEQAAPRPFGAQPPRTRIVRLTRLGDGAVHVTAMIDDRRLAPYPLSAGLRLDAGGWRAITVGG
jgi:hypothetical protein